MVFTSLLAAFALVADGRPRFYSQRASIRHEFAIAPEQKRRCPKPIRAKFLASEWDLFARDKVSWTQSLHAFGTAGTVWQQLKPHRRLAFSASPAMKGLRHQQALGVAVTGNFALGNRR